MIQYKKGNITSILLVIMFVIFASIILAIIFVYFQISCSIYDVKMNVFYLVQSSISKDDYENIAYKDYSIDKDALQENINMMLSNNYLKDKNKTKGIVGLDCYFVDIISRTSKVSGHTKRKYTVPIICIKYKIKFKPLISVLGSEVEIKMHDDIKLSLLEFK